MTLTWGKGLWISIALLSILGFSCLFVLWGKIPNGVNKMELDFHSWYWKRIWIRSLNLGTFLFIFYFPILIALMDNRNFSFLCILKLKTPLGESVFPDFMLKRETCLDMWYFSISIVFIFICICIFDFLFLKELLLFLPNAHEKLLMLTCKFQWNKCNLGFPLHMIFWVIPTLVVLRSLEHFFFFFFFFSLLYIRLLHDVWVHLKLLLL